MATTAQRSCGSCTLCCKVLSISEIGKQKDLWCPHCAIGKGCKIYGTRPAPCRTFECGYIMVPGIGEHWFPAQSKMVLASEFDGTRLIVRVDPARPDAWRQQPYYGEIKSWAASAVPAGEDIWVMVGNRLFVIFPDRDIDLGEVSPEDGVIAQWQNTPVGPRWIAEKIAADDPRMARVRPLSAA